MLTNLDLNKIQKIEFKKHLGRKQKKKEGLIKTIHHKLYIFQWIFLFFLFESPLIQYMAMSVDNMTH